MKKIINGKLYDTNSAKKLADHDNSLPTNDFAYFSEILYLKKTGEYFLYGYGGGNSRYGEWHGNSGGSGEKIIPLSPSDARAWAERLGADEYAKIFEAPAEKDRVSLYIQIKPSTRYKLDQIREETGKTISEIIDSLL